MRASGGADTEGWRLLEQIGPCSPVYSFREFLSIAKQQGSGERNDSCLRAPQPIHLSRGLSLGWEYEPRGNASSETETGGWASPSAGLVAWRVLQSKEPREGKEGSVLLDWQQIESISNIKTLRTTLWIASRLSRCVHRRIMVRVSPARYVGRVVVMSLR